MFNGIQSSVWCFNHETLVMALIFYRFRHSHRYLHDIKCLTCDLLLITFWVAWSNFVVSDDTCQFFLILSSICVYFCLVLIYFLVAAVAQLAGAGVPRAMWVSPQTRPARWAGALWSGTRAFPSITGAAETIYQYPRYVSLHVIISVCLMIFCPPLMPVQNY